MNSIREITPSTKSNSVKIFVNNEVTKMKEKNNNSKSNLSNIISEQYSKMIHISKEIINPSQSIIPLVSKNKNAQIPSEYIDDIWANLLDKEKLNNYSFRDIVSIQNDINEKMRAVLIDWLISVHHQLHLNLHTLFLTVNIIDRYISCKAILRGKFQLLGITALFIACKYEEITYPPVGIFVDYTAKTFDKGQVLEMESDILHVLGFELNVSTSIYFLEIISFAYNFNKDEFRNGCILLEAFLIDMKSCLYSQSEIALAACYIIIKLRKESISGEIWKEKNIQRIKQCAMEMYSYIENKDKIKYRAVYNKYSM